MHKISLISSSALALRLLIALISMLGFASVTVTIHGSEMHPPLLKSIELMEQAATVQWAYTRESHGDEGQRKERFDPRLPKEQQWQLIEQDQKVPNQAQQELYRKKYDDLFKRDTPAQLDLTSIVDMNTVELAQETTLEWRYSFQPMPDNEEDKKFMSAMLGHITIDKRSGQMTHITMKNSAPFKPAKMVKIKKLEIEMIYTPLEGSDFNLMQAVSTLAEGRFMGIKKFSQDQRVTFSDFFQID